MNGPLIRHMLTRLSLAVIFVGIGVWEIVQPSQWSSYVPTFFSHFISLNLFTMLHGVMMLAIGLAVLLGAYLKVASGLAALIMLTILLDLLMLYGFTDLIIRDLGVLLIALALVFDDARYLRLTRH